jgi:glycosyltransferase involved in cell wall biosynthesis
VEARNLRRVSARGSDLDPADGSGLEVILNRPLPKVLSLPAGRETALFCIGACFHRRQRVREIALTVDGLPQIPIAQRMPRAGLFRKLHPNLPPGDVRSIDGDPDSRQDPELHSYRSGFWATVPIAPRDGEGELELGLEARLADGTTVNTLLGTVRVVEPPEHVPYEGPGPSADLPLIAICMAAYNPNIELFRDQVESIQAQTYPNWVCVISDDCSEPERFEQVAEIVGEDDRFILSRFEYNQGFYRNFERALELAPTQADLLALSDQDDRWYPDKLEALKEAIGSAELAYSDLRRVDVAGNVRSETLWEGRRNNNTNFASLLISNTIVGASCLVRRRVVEQAVPFPIGPGWDFHDHWLALVAMAIGDIAYVDRPLYDQVQHPDAILGRVGAAQAGSDGSEPRRLRDRIPNPRGFLNRWRSAYFSLYLQRAFHARMLLTRCSAQLTRRKRNALRLMQAAARSPLALAWLVLRPARALWGRNETLGLETSLVRGVLWPYLIRLRTLGRQKPGRWEDDVKPSKRMPQVRQRAWLSKR